jgi:hypothetical protein
MTHSLKSRCLPLVVVLLTAGRLAMAQERIDLRHDRCYETGLHNGHTSTKNERDLVSGR